MSGRRHPVTCGIRDRPVTPGRPLGLERGRVPNRGYRLIRPAGTSGFDIKGQRQGLRLYGRFDVPMAASRFKSTTRRESGDLRQSQGVGMGGVTGISFPNAPALSPLSRRELACSKMGNDGWNWPLRPLRFAGVYRGGSLCDWMGDWQQMAALHGMQSRCRQGCKKLSWWDHICPIGQPHDAEPEREVGLAGPKRPLGQ